MKWKPTNKKELEYIIKDIIENQENDPDYKFGLRDIDVSLITDMSDLFSCYKNNENSEINKKIDWNDPRNNIINWGVSQVTNMSAMFRKSPFNQDISKWNVSQVTNMSNMFDSSNFNQDISTWDVSCVKDMSNMFAYSDFNQPIGYWDVSNVINMIGMFTYSPFNQDICQWNVSNVTDMFRMFDSSQFNQNISNWDVSNVTDMYQMFADSSFNHNLYTWINRLNKNIDLEDFNKDSEHEKRYGTIDSIDSFIDKQLTPHNWLQCYKESNNKEKFQLLKLLKHRDKKFIETLNQWLKKENVTIDI